MNTAAVAYRSRALVSAEMINVVGDRSSKVPYPPGGAPGGRPTGTQPPTHLVMRVWVKNAGYAKNVWADVHVFDQTGEVISSGTYTLRYSYSPDGDGDIFELDEAVHGGAGAAEGAARPASDARRVQYRVYYEVNGQVFTDNVLHQHDISTDEAERDDRDAGD